MTLISKTTKQEKHCLVACSEDKVNAGRCDCVNRMREIQNVKIMEDLKQGTRVEFDVQNFKGKGTIVGVATSGQPIIGASYIIEPDEKLKSEVYDYSHFVAWECQFKVIPDNSLPTEDQVLQTIFNCVFIRGIELETYQRNFSNEQSGLYDALVKLFKGQ